MTHQNHQTNGASLEDCHTNFFALTELYGIKWRKLVWGESGRAGGGEEGGAPLEDPVISSYARCLAGDILCVWRRVPQPSPPVDIYEMPAPAPPPPLSLRAAKELWIFWYGEEPDLNGLVAPELIASQGEQGSWESGLSYECRSLLFKALHNLIERCLLSRDFVRLGKWFVQPYDGDEEEVGKSPWHLSFSFAFFLHGESTVCASVDVRQHPPVRTLTARRLRARKQPAQHDHQVILAPFALAGRLTGRQWTDGDAETARLLDQWRALYPLETNCPAVEVICGGVRMRYPRAYVLLTEMEEGGEEAGRAGGGGAGGAAGAGAGAGGAADMAPRALRALAAPLPHYPPEVCYADVPGDKPEDFVDITRRTTCTCNKWRRRRGARAPAFHRRAPRHRPPACAGSCSPGSGGAASPAAAGSAPPSAGAPPSSPHHAAHHLQPHHTPIQATHVQVPTTLHTPAPTPDPLAPPTPAPPSAPPTKLYQGDSPLGVCHNGGGGGGGGGGLLLRRPVLPAEEARAPDTDHRHLSMLYDYSTVHAWLEHPVKRFKPSEPVFKEELALGSGNGDLYAGQEHTCVAAAAPEPASIKRERTDHEDVKEYKNLFTSDGLCPRLKDLDQIFDNSDDASGDETMQVSTPPETKCPLEERCGGGRCVRAEELSKMFPTPPSMEAHAQPSPGLSLPEEPASPPPDPIDDWSYVFRPPPLARYVGSSKYAPLPTLPSQLLPRLPLPHDAVYRPQPRAAPAPPPAADRAAAPPPPQAHSADKTPLNGEVKPSGRALSSPLGAGGAAAAARPACPLLVNVLLGDTALNLFRDHNFDSCTLCVCNAGARLVGNIRGADAAYLPDDDAAQDDDPPSCSCGFSAVVNRRLAHRAGLFYEDEAEITGAASRGGAGGGGALREVAAAAAASGARAGPACLLARAAAAAAAAPPHRPHTINLLEYSDGSAAATKALRAACGGGAYSPPSGPGTTSAVHRWPFICARAPRSSRDVLRLMRRLRPLLQDATQKRCCGARMWDGVSGPLTWRHFHRLAGRGNEDLCEPQPVPHLLVGHDKDWLSLSPYAVRHWERLALEPYGYARDVAYVVLAPAAGALDEPLRAFFREVSAAYEAARLGRHRALARLARDGLLRAAPRAAPDDWAGDAPPGPLGDYLRGYADALRALVPQLAALPLDRAALEPERDMRPPAPPDDAAPDDAAPAPPPGATGSLACDEEEGGPPALVIYLVEPPPAAANPGLALLSLLRLSDNAQRALDKLNPLFKFVSVDGVQEWWCGSSAEAARSLAFGVYAGLRRGGGVAAAPRSLTGFGPAAAAAMAKQPPWNLRAPAVVLAGARREAEWGSTVEAGAVLFVAYCLSHDQRWLLATATDARGELLDSVAINIHVPTRSRRRRSSPARRLGLTKLMDFILGVMSQLAQPWRLVVGRLGRIGHGELKGWSWLLSRKNLVRASGVLREMCGACAALGGAVAVTSACLVSTEPEHAMRLMADRFTPDERFSTHSQLSTPRDVTATHILVFPTSATTQSNHMPFEPPLANGDDPDMMFLGVDMADEDMGEDNMADLIISDMFTNMWGAQGSPRASPRRDADEDAEEVRGPRAAAEVGTLLQQPLALGYLVSTAPLPGMPAWWWAGAAHATDACPAFLKAALHAHAACVHAADDLAQLTRAKDHHAHPLDSPLTTDVLRYVLERYNALSWLSLDARSSDRVSCLPLHVQVLMQLYHTTAALP